MKHVGVTPTSQKHKSPLFTMVHNIGQWCTLQAGGAQQMLLVHYAGWWCTLQVDGAQGSSLPTTTYVSQAHQ